MGPDSDIYLIRTFDGKWDCFCASPCVTMNSLQDVLAHLINHTERGDTVPDYAIDRVKEELSAAEEGVKK